MQETWLRASCHMSFDVALPTPMVFMLRPRSAKRQWVAAEEYHLLPSIPVQEYTDSFGNLCQRLVAPVGEFEVNTSVVARVAEEPPIPADAGFVDVSELPDDVLCYLLPSRYCEVDRFGNMALEIVQGKAPGADQVIAISEWVQGAIRNRPLSSTYPISASEVNQQGEGVCRDLAQIAITLCRALCIPARLTVGYLLDLEPMDIHAWFEAYVGGRWWTVDPSAPGLKGGRIALARGRDAADVAIYNQYGPLLLPRDMSVNVSRLDSSAGPVL